MAKFSQKAVVAEMKEKNHWLAPPEHSENIKARNSPGHPHSRIGKGSEEGFLSCDLMAARERNSPWLTQLSFSDRINEW